MKTRKLNRQTRLLIGLGLGALLGSILHPYADVKWVGEVNRILIYPVGQIFLKIIFMSVVPLVFSALALGVFELCRWKNFRKIALRTLFYTAVLSTASVVIGISLVNIFKPGIGVDISNITSGQSASVLTIKENAVAAKGVVDMIIGLIPKNPVAAATNALDGDMLPFMVFALFFGVAMASVGRSKGGVMKCAEILDEIFAVSMKIIGWAFVLAPFGVFSIIFNTVFKTGAGVLLSLLFYVAVVVIGLLIQQFVVYSGLLKLVARRSPVEFFRQCKDVMIFAFSTASSNATLPVALKAAEADLGLSKTTSRFVLTVGATANQNGTALFEGVTVLFLAQVYGIDLSFMQQVQVVLMAIIAGIGTAGVPGGSLPLIMVILQMVGIPPEGIGLILGVDRFLDMCRTAVNVGGDLVISALVDRNDGDFVEEPAVEPAAVG